jgi:hypothetical protein
MFAITNATRHAATATILTDADGRDLVVAVAKATFALARGRRPELAELPTPLVWADEYRDEPGKSSLTAAADFAPGKPRADVIVLGSARTPGGKPVTGMSVSVRVGAVTAKLEVIGDRVWKKGLMGVAPGKPERFTEMPLTWERAYGGTCPAKGGEGLDSWRPNPVGRGFWLTDKDAADQPMPNLEWPDDPLKKLAGRPAPAGFGFVSPDWESRASLAGTYDAKWEKSRMPLLPEDFDPGFFNVAPAALQAARYFEGGEPVRLQGLHDDGEFAFELPRDRVDVQLLTPGDRLDTHPAVLDTVVIDTGAGLLQLVWRACVRAPEPLTRLQHVRVRSEKFPAPEETVEAEPAGAGAGGPRV